MKNIIDFDFNTLKKFNKVYVLVSGGYDSTYLYEIIKEIILPWRIFPVNCYNPYEYNETIKKMEKNDRNFIRIEPKNYKDIIKKSFLNLPKAYKLRAEKRYHKKIFPCCYVLKHKNFKKDKRFREENTVVIDGIKWGDGKQRRIWLSQMNKGTNSYNIANGKPTFLHRHRNGILYCYPYRDYPHYELPEEIKEELEYVYPYIDHSGCSLCPVLVLWDLKYEHKRYERSVQYAKNLGVFPNMDIREFIEIKKKG